MSDLARPRKLATRSAKGLDDAVDVITSVWE
jgi:hypothetical protein